jgi:hypothetical protein
MASSLRPVDGVRDTHPLFLPHAQRVWDLSASIRPYNTRPYCSAHV